MGEGGGRGFWESVVREVGRRGWWEGWRSVGENVGEGGGRRWDRGGRGVREGGRGWEKG